MAVAGTSSEESKVSRSLEGITKGVASMLPPSFNTDDDNNDSGLEPSQLYREFTWMISNYSKINKREVSSDSFEVGGYKWYFLLYPHGCDFHNFLSLFLCVANHDMLLPGWNHCAQFTLCMVNKDPKKSKYSDALHRFWKKEHDWGWKKFMELSKVVNDGFIDVDTDTLVIKAKVQVIRERIDRPFRCLASEYRRELARVYSSNVEVICKRFVKETRGKLEDLIEDKGRWSSFCNFWLGIDEKSRNRLTRVKSDIVLKEFVKRFFIEKEAVTAALMMDSLYDELKALKGQTKSDEVKGECDAPVIQMESDSFMLVDDLLPLLKRTVLEPLPLEDESHTKDGVKNYEMRLAELGRRTVELSVLAYMSSKIEVAGREDAALKRQEELIREEEEEKQKAKAKTKKKIKTKAKTKTKTKTKTFV